MSAKPDYGIDAPSAIRALSLGGMFFCLASSREFSLNIFGPVLSFVFLVTGLLSITTAFLMLYSSKSGKRSERDKLINSLNIKGDEIILDVGCGKGLLLIAAAKKLISGKAAGVDIWSPKDLALNSPASALNNARLEGVENRVEVITADMRRLPFKENSIDIIVASMAVHNVESKEERRNALQEIHRVLKPDGKIAIMDFKHTDEYMRVFKELGRKNVRVSGLKFGMFPPVRVVSV